MTKDRICPSIHGMEKPDPLHPLWLRIVHWLNAVAVVIMIMSGWRIYNAAPVFPFRFPNELTLGGWLAGALDWHFAAMWLLFFNGLFYLVMNIVTGRTRRKFGGLSVRGLISDLRDVLRLRMNHTDPLHYNTIQKIAYIGVILSLVMMVLSGLVMWKPVQFPVLRTLLGDYDFARIIHFVCMVMICLFIFIHIVMVMIVPKTLKGMVTGRV